MFRRIVVVIGLLVLVGIALGQVLSQEPDETPEATPAVVVVVVPAEAATPSATPTPTLTPTPTTTPGVVGRQWAAAEPLLRNLGSTGANFTDFMLSILQLAVTILGLWLVYRILRLLFSRRAHTVIEKLGDASGDEGIGKIVEGLTVSLRQHLLGSLAYIRAEAYNIRLPSKDRNIGEGGVRQGSAFSNLSAKSRQIRSKPEQQAEEVIKAVSTFAPDQVKPAVEAINAVLGSRDITVAGMLQRRGDIPGRFGFSFAIDDFARGGESVVFTVWESHDKRGYTNTPSGGPTPLPAGAPGASPPLATVLVDTAANLAAASLFKEANEFLLEALKIDSSRADAMIALASGIGKQRKQEADNVAYKAGEALEQAGLIEQAITSYSQDLPTSSGIDPGTSWRTALTATGATQANAYLELARVYRLPPIGNQPGMYLFDVSLDLYIKAITLGSPTAVTEAMDFQHTLADHLTQAGQLLYRIARYQAAETYLKQALDHVPEHPDAAAVLAGVKQALPPSENVDAQASRELGMLYETRAAFKQAKDQFEEALKKEPASTQAREALVRALDNAWTLDERYRRLLPPAAYRLAVELSRKEMEKYAYRWWMWLRRDQRMADIHNFVGLLYYAGAMRWKVTAGDFYGQAVTYFKRAIACDGKFPHAHENLADTYSQLGELEVNEPEKGRNWQWEALLEYQRAEQTFKATRWKDVNEQITTRRLRIGRASAMLLTSDPELCQQARALVQGIAEENDWSSEPDTRLLYNLACFYSIDNAKMDACKYLAFALARDKNQLWWEYAEKDPDLASIRGDIPTIKARLLEAMVNAEQEGKKLHELTGIDFTQRVLL